MDSNSHNEIMRAIGRIEGKLEGVSIDISEIKIDMKETTSKVLSLEQSRAFQKGQVTILAILWGSVSAIGMALLEHFIGKR